MQLKILQLFALLSSAHRPETLSILNSLTQSFKAEKQNPSIQRRILELLCRERPVARLRKKSDVHMGSQIATGFVA